MAPWFGLKLLAEGLARQNLPKGELVGRRWKRALQRKGLYFFCVWIKIKAIFFLNGFI